MTSYTPGEAVEQSGFTLDTLRYYEKIGLLGVIARDPAGRRVFTDDDLAWLHLLRCLRDTGMPIAEMLHYTELCRSGPSTVNERLALLRAHDARVEAKMDLLRAQQVRVQWKISLYTGEATAHGGHAMPGEAAVARAHRRLNERANALAQPA